MELKPIRWPEWKELHDAILPLIDSGITEFPYEELSTLARIDVRSDRGRQQFYKFRRELLRTRQLWMENVAGSGYVIIPAKDQPGAAYKRVRAAKRKVGMATAINSFVKIEELTPEQRAMQAATSMILHQLSTSFHQVARKFHLASKQAATMNPGDLGQLLKSIEGPPPPPKKRQAMAAPTLPPAKQAAKS